MGRSRAARDSGQGHACTGALNISALHRTRTRDRRHITGIDGLTKGAVVMPPMAGCPIVARPTGMFTGREFSRTLMEEGRAAKRIGEQCEEFGD